MKKIIALLLAFMLVFSLTAVLSACGEDEPVVEDPTTEDPTTEDPTTEDPTTEEPTTEEPTTEEPTTEEPTTEDPTTEDPTTEEPTTEDPTTEEPTTEDPTTEEPTTEDPTTEEPTTEDPTTEDPTVEDPTTEEPTIEDPTVDVNRDVVLIEKGKAYFNFVVADGYTSTVNKTVDTLISDLAKFGLAVSRVYDNKTTVTECEVLVGTVQTRGDEYKLDPHVYGYEGYTIRIIDGKIIILGGSEEALVDAIEAFKKDILGITKKTKVLTDATMTAAQNVEIIQSGYNVESVSVAGNNLKDYVIVADENVAGEITTAKSIQDLLYKKTGMWLPIVSTATEEELVFEIKLTTAKTCKSDKGFILEIADGDILVDCGFANKIEEATLAFVMTEITNSKNKNPSFVNNYKYEKVDYKNIYYKDFGAKGDGYTDDFFAIMNCHAEANLYGHTVNAESTAIYYLGKGSGYSTITVQTDTNWNGCQFIFDDSEIKAPPYYPNSNTATGERGDPEYYTSIFSISNSRSGLSYSQSNSPIKTLYEGATNIGFAPGFEALVMPYNANIYQFIRYGANQNSGQSQREVIHVDADGNIDPDTPVQWSYDVITSLTVTNAAEDPITINGGDNRRTLITTDFNNAPSQYTYYARNIKITRSNVTIKNIVHEIINEGDTGAPYNGFINITNANNVVVDNCQFQCPKGYYTIGNAGTSVGMGTYELSAGTSTNILWKNCTQSNLYKEDGSMQSDGMMGTNFCKNLMFENMVVCSFDAHCGTYGAKLVNSTCEHINFIGEGTIYLENMTILANPAGNGLVLRSDYGSTWQGDLVIKGLNLKYYYRNSFSLVNAQWTNHFFGYTCYLPENIWMEDVRITEIGYSVDAFGNRTEWNTGVVNAFPLNLYKNLNGFTSFDISDPEADCFTKPTEDVIKCQCEDGFNDTTGDGLCDNNKCGLPETANPNQNRNPYIVTKNVYIKNCPGLTVAPPKIPAFEDMNMYYYSDEKQDYELVDWWINGSFTCPTE